MCVANTNILSNFTLLASCSILEITAHPEILVIINPRRACAARVTVYVLGLCLSVCVPSFLLPHTF